MKVLLTGGTGYIGSHAAIALLEAGHKVALLDNLSNSKASVAERIHKLAGTEPEFHELDMRDFAGLLALLESYRPEAVIHLAGLKSVGESVAEPLRYYEVNLVSALNLCRAMLDLSIHKLVFSSSATVYGLPDSLPLTEASPITKATNPYGSTKLYIEQLLCDAAAANP
ncbi:MAG: SDR family NAD(P)-dependent oxidoreductase, partial [Pseudomonadales bacterium]